MRRVHYLSGIFIGLFTILHLINHLMAMAGPEVHIQTMSALRQLYRNIFIESALVLAVLVQMSSGIKLFLKKRKEDIPVYEKLKSWSGLYLALFFIIHVSAVFGGRYIFNLDTNYYFGVAGLNSFPTLLFFAPYYGLAMLSFFIHLSTIHYTKMPYNFQGFSVAAQSKLIVLLGGIITIAVFYGLTNGFKGVEIPKEYNVIIGR